MARGKNKVFSVCGHLCGQSCFCAAFCNRGKSRKCRRRKALRRFTLPRPGYRHGTPKAGAIPTSLYPDIHFSAMIPWRGVKIKFFLSVVIPVVKPLLCRFQQPGKIPQMQVSQGFAAFRLTLSRIPPRHSQITCHTNWATPEHSYIIPWADQKMQGKSVCPQCGHTDFDDVGPPILGDAETQHLEMGLAHRCRTRSRISWVRPWFQNWVPM